MKNEHDSLHPDRIDSELKRLIAAKPSPGASLEEQVVYKMHKKYEEQKNLERASLDRVFLRFEQRIAQKVNSGANEDSTHLSIIKPESGTYMSDNSAPTNRHNTLPIQMRVRSHTRQRMGTLMVASLLLLLVSASIIAFIMVGNTRFGHTSAVKPTPKVTPTLIQGDTTCPAAGTSRAAVLPPLTQPFGQSIVYISDDVSDNTAQYHLLERYDLATHKTTTLLSLDTSRTNQNASYIYRANLSPDGKWIILVTSPVLDMDYRARTGPFEIQLIRIDGQYRQTLYCAANNSANNSISFGNILFSPDMQSIAFSLRRVNLILGDTDIYRLDVANGGVPHLLFPGLAGSNRFAYEPEAWLDNSHIMIGVIGTTYVQNAQGDFDNAPGKILSLDITQGDNQQIGQMSTLLDNTNLCQKFDISPDRSFIVTSVCQSSSINRLINWSPTGTLLVHNLADGTQHTILNSSNLRISSVYLISNTQILFTTQTQSPQTQGPQTQSPQNTEKMSLYRINSTNPQTPGPQRPQGPQKVSLWRINTDGTGLTHIDGDAISFFNGGYKGQTFNIVSNDGSMYIEENAPETALGTTLSYKSFQNGQQVVFSDNMLSYVVGWTKS